MRANAAAAQSEASRQATASLPRRPRARLPVVKSEAQDSADNRASINRQPPRLVVRVPAKDEEEKSEVNRESIDLQPRRLPVQVRRRAKREVVEREGKVPMVNPVGSQEAERLVRLNAARDNRSAERKKARGLLRRAGRNNSLLTIASGLGVKIPRPFLCLNAL